MIGTRTWKAFVVAVLTILAVSRCRADSSQLASTSGDLSQTVAAGTTLVQFDVSLVNYSTTDTLFLNGDGASVDSALIAIDDSPFFANSPFSLAPGEGSGPFEMFDLDLPTGLPPGTYTGVFSILGGADGGAGSSFDDIGDIDFSLTINNPSTTPMPEPGELAMLLAGLASLSLFAIRRSKNRAE